LIDLASRGIAVPMKLAFSCLQFAESKHEAFLTEYTRPITQVK
jgi:hypothetical protein